MIENSYRLINEIFKDDYNGDALLINTRELNSTYKYIGLWYARDGNEDTSITTEIYLSDDKMVKPEEFKIEMKENSFKQFNRLVLPLDKTWIWIATRIDNGQCCKMKTGDVKEGNVYINYKVVHNKGNLFDIVSCGNFNGGKGNYYGIYCEDNQSKIDYKDLIMFFVALKDLPPEDWKMDHYSIGINGLPIITQTFKFNDNRKYSDWFGQNPMK